MSRSVTRRQPAAAAVSVLTLIALALAGCPRGDDVVRTEEGWLVHGREEARDTVARHVHLGDRALAIDIAHGAVAITGSETAEASLIFERIGRGDSRAAAERRLQSIEIEEFGDAERYEFAVGPDADRATEVRLTAEIPPGVDVIVRTERRTELLQALSGSIDVLTKTVCIEVTALRASQLHARNERGHHRIEFAHVPRRADIRLRSANGNLELTLPQDASLQLVAETRVGSIGVENLEVTRERFEDRGPARRYRARLGGGEGRLVAETEVGNIRFIAAEPTATDEVAASAAGVER
jgi:hypothetical protein